MIEHAPGGPGIPPTWTSSAKDMVGCALGISRLWFTLGFGIINEVYYPRVDIPQIRDLGCIIADGEGFSAEVKRVANYRIRLLHPVFRCRDRARARALYAWWSKMSSQEPPLRRAHNRDTAGRISRAPWQASLCAKRSRATAAYAAAVPAGDSNALPRQSRPR
jgi:Glucodextranase, domain N